MKILLAEDNPINQRVASLMFNQLGFNCDVVSNGQEAVEMHKANKYDLILMVGVWEHIVDIDQTIEKKYI